jgi:hypothetical protein
MLKYTVRPSAKHPAAKHPGTARLTSLPVLVTNRTRAVADQLLSVSGPRFIPFNHLYADYLGPKTDVSNDSSRLKWCLWGWSCQAGGPGRAGGGAELGGLRALHHYLQRTAIQGHPSLLDQFGL